MLSHFDEWMEVVITHELVHIFQLDSTGPIGSLIRSVMGRWEAGWPTFPSFDLPRWTTEGLATYYESSLTTSGRVRGSYIDMVLRTAVLEDGFEGLGPGLGEFSKLASRRPGLRIRGNVLRPPERRLRGGAPWCFRRCDRAPVVPVPGEFGGGARVRRQLFRCVAGVARRFGGPVPGLGRFIGPGGACHCGGAPRSRGERGPLSLRVTRRSTVGVCGGGTDGRTRRCASPNRTAQTTISYYD